MGLFEIFDDGERLEQYAAIILDQRRQRHLWIDAPKFIGVVRVGIEIDEHDFGRQFFQVERDANAKTRLRSPEGEEFHGEAPSFFPLPLWERVARMSVAHS